MTPESTGSIENNSRIRRRVITITNVKTFGIAAVFSVFALFHEQTIGVAFNAFSFAFRLKRDIIVFVRRTKFMELFIDGTIVIYRVI